jgi:hypothetical protein
MSRPPWFNQSSQVARRMWRATESPPNPFSSTAPTPRAHTGAPLHHTHQSARAQQISHRVAHPILVSEIVPRPLPGRGGGRGRGRWLRNCRWWGRGRVLRLGEDGRRRPVEEIDGVEERAGAAAAGSEAATDVTALRLIMGLTLIIFANHAHHVESLVA